MSLVPYVEKPQMTPKTAELCATLEAKYYGKLFNTFKMLAHIPEILAAFVPFIETLFTSGKIEARLRELIILRTTLLNKSNYCATHHFYAAKKAGLMAEEIADVHRFRESPFFSKREKLAMAFAEEVTLRPGEVDPDLREKMKAGFDAASLVEITAIIGMSNFLNRFNDTLALDLDLPPAPTAFYPKRERWMHDDD